MPWKPQKGQWKPSQSPLDEFSKKPTLVTQTQIRPAAVVPISFSGGAITNFKNVFPNKTAFPAAPLTGDVVYRTDTNKCYMWNGASWVEFV